MKVIYCDICKNDITKSNNNPIYFILKIFGNRSGNTILSKDICNECSSKIENYINGIEKGGVI